MSGKRIPSLLKKFVTSEYGMEDAVAPRFEEQKIKGKLRYLLFDRLVLFIILVSIIINWGVVAIYSISYREATDGGFTTTIFDHIKVVIN